MGLTKVTHRMTKDASINVLDYGAVGDGVTDDQLAIQAAIDAAPAGVRVADRAATFVYDGASDKWIEVNST